MERRSTSLRLRDWCLLAVVTCLIAFTAPRTPSASADVPRPAHVAEVSIFYYPWYASVDHDDHWAHWDQSGKTPPDDIGANFYPALGAYSSADTGVIDRHMRQIAAAGIDTVVSSWWGRDSYEDQVLNAIIPSASALHLRVAAHIEPYGGRSDRSLRSDFDSLYDRGVRTFYIYQANKLSQSGIAAIADAHDDVRVYVETSNENSVRDGSFMNWAHDAHADGLYTYDPRGFSPSDLGDICNKTRAAGLYCVPSIGPGWDGTRATKIPGTINREDGRHYDEFWQSALDAGADIVSITSFNEWHEGTQIEPAAAHCVPNSNYCYNTYDGAYGLHGNDAQSAYLDHTLYWTTRAKGHAPSLSQRLTIVSNALGKNDASVVDHIRSLKVQRPNPPVAQ